MICPKCKKQIPEKSLKCGFCSTKIGTICKKCNSYNSIYNLKCVSCGNELLKLCPHCKGVNIPEATKCRKCGKPFEIKKIKRKKTANIVNPNHGIINQQSHNIDSRLKP